MNARLCLVLIGLCSGCASLNGAIQVPLKWVGLADDPPAIDPIELSQHIATLASDAFEGRLPGTAGEQKTLQYLVEQFERQGALPGNPNGSFLQPVELAGIKPQADVGISVAKRPLPLEMHRDINVSSNRLQGMIRVRKSPIVFVGYGVQAPEYQWDDYKGMDVRGKTLLMLVNDPQVRDSDGHLSTRHFKGKAMTYYGRWAYKHEIAAKQGAAAVLVIHETEAAGYPWSVVQGRPGSEHFTLASGNKNLDQVPVKGWIRDGFVRDLLAEAGYQFDDLKQAANRADFRPLELPAMASFQVRNRLRQVQSANVVAKIEGRTRKDEYIVYSAHWDHLGRDPKRQGDQIFNGAVDNATGTAGLIELAQVFAADPPEVSVLLVAVTAEEQGLLGAKYYVEHPLYPLSRHLANINMDAMNVWGATGNVVLVGQGQNSLEADLIRAAKRQGRQVSAEPTPEKGFYYRSDHFEFARKGVPALYARSGTEFSGHQPGFGLQKTQHYIAHDYHQVSDDVKAEWDLSGLVLDLQLLEMVGRQVAASDIAPTWHPQSEFHRAGQARHP